LNVVSMVFFFPFAFGLIDNFTGLCVDDSGVAVSSLFTRVNGLDVSSLCDLVKDESAFANFFEDKVKGFVKGANGTAILGMIVTDLGEVVVVGQEEFVDGFKNAFDSRESFGELVNTLVEGFT
ncbi:hypothetical protein HDU76_010453, partial [Blyttiomyces sp. JEL0837]